MSALFGFLLALLVLVTVHEWGHFWTARRLGVPVVRFSIGMGGAIWQKTVGGVEYRLAWLPLGGYVMFADPALHTLTPEQAERSFPRRRLWEKALIVAAGPAINFLLAWVLMVIVLMWGVTAPKAWLSAGVVGTPWAEVSGSQTLLVSAVNGASVTHLEELPILLLRQLHDQETLTFEVQDRQGQMKSVTVSAEAWRTVSWSDPRQQMGLWGLSPAIPDLPARIDHVEPNSAAEQGGLQTGDLLLSLNGLSIEHFMEVSQWVKQNPLRPVTFVVLRNGQEMTLTLTVGQQTTASGQSIGFLGIKPQIPADWQGQMFTQVRYDFADALWRAPEKLWALTVLTLRAITRLITGQSGLEQLSGPVGIAQAAGNSLDMGFVRFIQFLAVLSLSLAVLNLLPLPMLDGGHLLLFALEGITGRGLPESWLLVWQKVGLVLIVSFTLLAVFSDVKRLFGS